MRKLANIFVLCALGTVLAVGCGDDDDDDGGGGTGGSATGAAAGSDSGGSASGGTGTGGGGGTAEEGVCAVECTTATVEDDCPAESVFASYSCENGFCTAVPKACEDDAGPDQNCDLLNDDSEDCIDVDGVSTCLRVCDPDATDDLCEAFSGTCTGVGDDDETFCEIEIEPQCLGGVDVGEPCALGGMGGGGGGGGASGDQFGVCTAAGTCVCTSDSQCTADGYACNTN